MSETQNPAPAGASAAAAADGVQSAPPIGEPAQAANTGHGDGDSAAPVNPDAAISNNLSEDSPEDKKGNEAEDESDHDMNSRKVTLADLCARAGALYAHRNYFDAADLYARAAEMQSNMRGELDPENAEILFLYGRSLLRVGQKKSDVFGAKAPDGGAASGVAKTPAGELDGLAEAGASAASEKEDKAAAAAVKKKRGLIKFEGDEALEESDDDDDADADAEDGADEGEQAGDGDQAAEEDEQDELEAAFQALDLASVLFRKKLDKITAVAEAPVPTEGAEGKNGEDVKKADESEAAVAAAQGGNDELTRHIKERLGDTHDHLAEIYLENERYPAAIEDCRAALRYKTEIYPEESELVAEAHYKLSLALEFASVQREDEVMAEAGAEDEEGEGSGDAAKAKAKEDGGGGSSKPWDQALRDEAASELEAAIKSQKLKLQGREVELATSASPEDNDLTRASIVELKEILADMEQRLVDLRKPPIDVGAAVSALAGQEGLLSGILAAAVGAGESDEQIQARIREATKNANDLTAFVRRKDDKPNGKRKADDIADVATGEGRGPEDAGEGESEAKKARIETTEGSDAKAEASAP